MEGKLNNGNQENSYELADPAEAEVQSSACFGTSKITEDDKGERNLFTKWLRSTRRQKKRGLLTVKSCFGRLGVFIFDRPILLIILSLLSGILLGTGWLFMKMEEDLQKQYALPNSRTLQEETDILDRNGRLPGVAAMVLITRKKAELESESSLKSYLSDRLDSASQQENDLSSSDGLLTPQILKRMAELDKSITTEVVVDSADAQKAGVWEGSPYDWESICEHWRSYEDEAGSKKCTKLSVLDMYVSESLFGRPIYARHWPYVYNARLRRAYPAHLLMQDVTVTTEGRNPAPIIRNATGFVMYYYLNTTNAAATELWSRAFINFMKSFEFDVEDVVPYFATTMSWEVEVQKQSKMASKDYYGFSFSILFVLIYTFGMTFSKKLYKAKPLSAVSGVCAALLGALAGGGLCYHVGLTHTQSMNCAPFLILGIGLDDLYVILNAYSLTYLKSSARERIRSTLEEAGLSMTITTLTNVVAFSIGATSPYFAVRNFCIVLVAGLVAGYTYAITFFTACLSLEARFEKRSQESHRKGACNDIVSTGTPLQNEETLAHSMHCLKWDNFLHTPQSGSNQPIIRSIRNSLLFRFFFGKRWDIGPSTKQTITEMNSSEKLSFHMSNGEQSQPEAAKNELSQNSDKFDEFEKFSREADPKDQITATANCSSSNKNRPTQRLAADNGACRYFFDSNICRPHHEGLNTTTCCSGSTNHSEAIEMTFPEKADKAELDLESSPITYGKNESTANSTDMLLKIGSLDELKEYMEKAKYALQNVISDFDVDDGIIAYCYFVLKFISTDLSHELSPVQITQRIVIVHELLKVFKEGRPMLHTRIYKDDPIDWDHWRNSLACIKHGRAYLSITRLQEDQSSLKEVRETEEAMLRILRQVALLHSTQVKVQFDPTLTTSHPYIENRFESPPVNCYQQCTDSYSQIKHVSEMEVLDIARTSIYEPSGNLGIIQRKLFLRFSSDFLQLRITKFFILLLFAGYIALASYGITKVKVGLDMESLFPKDSYLRQANEVARTHFTSIGESSWLLFEGAVEWWKPETQQKFIEFSKELRNTNFYVEMQNGMEEFLLEKQSDTSIYDEATFLKELRSWLRGSAGRFYVPFFTFDERTLSLIEYQFPYYHVIEKDTEKKLQFMQFIRGVLDSYKTTLPGVVYDSTFKFLEADLVIWSQTINGIASAFAAVLLVSFVMLDGIRSILLVTLVLCSLVLGLLGVMPAIGIQLNMISMVTLIMSIGFCVDYTLHVAHSFSEVFDYNDGNRMVTTLSLMGPPIINGCLSTFLSMLPLSWRHEFLHTLFFKMVTAILFFGLLHGIILLPLLLSFFGSPPITAKSNRKPTINKSAAV